MQTIWPPTQDSIFGYTQGGVPNPNIAHRHPYPTRYHGPNYTVPGTAKDTYVERPYAVPSFVGMGQNGLGRAPLFDHVSGSGLLDAVAGAALGFVASPTKTDDGKIMWALIGAGSLYMAGMAGLIGFGAALAYKHDKIKIG